MRAAALFRPAASGIAAILMTAGLSGGPELTPTVVESGFHSAAVNGQDHFAIYLPTRYDRGRERFPVVYFLHGLPATDADYKGDWVFKIGQAAERSGHPVIVVGAQGARAGDADPEWHDWGPGRNWETATARELVDYVDAHYRTIRDRRARALIGVSAGGYGAAIIGLRHPETYSVVESWSGYFHATNVVGNAPLEVGSPEDNQRASVHTYVGQARHIEVRYGLFHFSFYVGDQDPYFGPENARLHQELLAAGVMHVYAHYPGAHSAGFWALHQDEWVARAVKELEPAA